LKLSNVDVSVSLDIKVHAPDGIPEEIVRAIRENYATLKLKPPDFES